MGIILIEELLLLDKSDLIAYAIGSFFYSPSLKKETKANLDQVPF